MIILFHQKIKTRNRESLLYGYTPDMSISMNMLYKFGPRRRSQSWYDCLSCYRFEQSYLD